MKTKTKDILRIRDLALSFNTEEGEVEALDGVAFSIKNGSVSGLIGETGCGKSVTGLTILGLLDENARIKRGEIIYKRENLLTKKEEELEREIRGKEIAMIFQDPGSSLNPVFTVENQITESIKMYRNAGAKGNKEIAIEQLERVKLPDAANLLKRYPHELSGGMKQRVMIAMMLACNPSLLIADEPTTALDVSIQAQFINVLRELQSDLGTSILYITHDLAVISEICNSVSVMYAGRIVEDLPVETLFNDPIHPYTKKLVYSVPGVKTKLEDLEEIPGSVPRLINPPAGCRFHPRCDKAKAICSQETPNPVSVEPDHCVACHLISDRGGKQ
ncbi:ABC transporter ATP-binding protein [Candidatus Bipolaricaulota bacterium]|nr:ABC transporter ATP-binding protein [Candidatus Bipolaricaulota bacterium]